MKKHYQIIDPGLAVPKLALSPDTQVRCLSYIIHRIDEIVSIPKGILLEIIPVKYLGRPYPAIGMYAETQGKTDQNLTQFSFIIEEKIATFIEATGLDSLLAQSCEEDAEWQNILKSYGYS